MDNKDEIIAKLKRENAYLKSLLEQNGISLDWFQNYCDASDKIATILQRKKIRCICVARCYHIIEDKIYENRK